MSGFDYYYRADDDTYAVMENLFKVAKMRSPSEAYMTGYRLTHEPMSNHFSGGGGYLISRPALSVIVDRALDRHPQCPSYDGWKDDLYIAACATAVGVRLYDTVNVNGLSLFYWGNIRTFVKDALHHSKVSGSKTLCRRNGSDAPADEHISFHYMGPSMQYIMEFLVYYAWPLGLRNYDYCDNKEQQK
ncbi:unnamed protein product [Calicophoron daubneyi]|uniref:Hexosyltransferase n=1 Tax=Calicophoron daubneyi TaxID=300641 RepID=A0AAV2TGV0_CALDB